MGMKKVSFECDKCCIIDADDDGRCVFTAIIEDGCVFVPKLCPVFGPALWEEQK